MGVRSRFEGIGVSAIHKVGRDVTYPFEITVGDAM